MPVQIVPESLQRIKALVLTQTLQLPDRYIVALVEGGDLGTVLPQALDQRPEYPLLALFHTKGKGLGDQDVLKPVHRKAGELIRLTENQAAAAVIRRTHHRFTVIQRVAYPAAKKSLIKGIIGVAGKDPYPDLGMIVDPAGAEIAPLAADNIHHIAVAVAALHRGDFLAVHPRVSGAQAALRLGRNGKDRKIPCNHSIFSLPKSFIMIAVFGINCKGAPYPLQSGNASVYNHAWKTKWRNTL